MAELHSLAAALAKGNLNVVITGETGSGKEILAEVVHRRSSRSERPLVRASCGGPWPRSLEDAAGGTVLLDQVADLPLLAQAQLTRLVEDSAIRFLSTSNRDLQEEMARGSFRPDLYHRLCGAVLTVPPLRYRRCEIEPLAERFLGSAAAELALASPPRLTAEAVDFLLTYPWPGNVRELRNVMERVVLVSRGEAITPEHLLAASGLALGRPAAGREATRLRLVRGTRRGAAHPEWAAPPDDEQTRVAQALRACAGNQTRAARALGISRATLIRRLREFGLPRPRSSKP